MIGNECEGMEEIDTCQRSIKRIVQGYLNEINQLKKDILRKETENNGLIRQNVQFTQQLKIFEEHFKFCSCPNFNKLCLSKDSQFEGFHEEVSKEVEDISTLELDSQFVSDSDELKKEKIITSCSTTNVLGKMFSFNDDSKPCKQSTYNSTPPKHINDTILVDESPTTVRSAGKNVVFVPETMPQHLNETTPRKSKNETMPMPMYTDTNDIRVIPETNYKDFNYDSPKSSPLIRLTPSDKLMGDNKMPFNISQLISPSRRLNNSPSKFKDALTPKRKLFGSKQAKSPKTSRTPRKKVSSLKTTHRMEADFSSSGVRKLTQTQLNIACFKKFKSNENVPAVGNVSSPVKKEPVDGDHLKPSTPLNSLENSPDPNETNLTSSAIRKVADDIVIDVKPIFTSSYDRIPDPISFEGRKILRKRLPGQECPDCVKYYEIFGNGNEDMKQEILNRCSRHRTKNVDLNSTPEGFWKPMITQTPR